MGAGVGPNRLELGDHLQGVVEGSIVAQVTLGQEVAQQDEQLACAHYERDGPEHKQVEVETEVLRQGGIAWVDGYAELVVAAVEATPLGCPRPGRLGAVFCIP